MNLCKNVVVRIIKVQIIDILQKYSNPYIVHMVLILLHLLNHKTLVNTFYSVYDFQQLRMINFNWKTETVT